MLTPLKRAPERGEALTKRLAEIRAQLAAFENKSPVFDPADMRKAGAFVSLTEDGFLHIDRGYVRREHEAATVRTQSSDEASTMDEDDGYRPGEGDSTPPGLVTLPSGRARCYGSGHEQECLS